MKLVTDVHGAAKLERLNQAVDLMRRSGEKILPKDLVKAAQAEDHPLHSCFEWDDEKAAVNFERRGLDVFSVRHSSS